MLSTDAKTSENASVTNDVIETVRDFNRFYTKIVGLLNDAFLGTQFSLPQARIVYELMRFGPKRASFLAHDLSMDLGQLSRLVQSLRTEGVIISTTDPADARAQILSLSDVGQDKAEALNEKSRSAVAGLLTPLSAFEQQSVIQNMALLKAHFKGITQSKVEAGIVRYRGLEIGDIGYLTTRQAQIYKAEYRWNVEFEALIAGIYRDYVMLDAPTKKEFWVAEIDGATAGSICVVPTEQPDVAQLRLLYVEPFARGRGLAHQLVQNVIQFSEQAGYNQVTLWTQDCLSAARSVYSKSGFMLEREEPHTSFGQELNGQYWSKSLR